MLEESHQRTEERSGPIRRRSDFVVRCHFLRLEGLHWELFDEFETKVSLATSSLLAIPVLFATLWSIDLQENPSPRWLQAKRTRGSLVKVTLPTLSRS